MCCFITWCNNNQGFLSAVLAIVSICISFLALYFSYRIEKKQYANALYDKRLAVLKSMDELMEFITHIEDYHNRLCADTIQEKEQVLKMMESVEINMEWVYEFKKAKFVVGKSKIVCVNKISEWVFALLRNYRIFKESVNQNILGNDDIENVFSNIREIKENVQDLREFIEEKLYL